MDEKEISFLSSRGRGISPEFVVLKEYLLQQDADLRFRYFVNYEKKNYLKKRAIKQAKSVFIENSRTIVCMDDSLDVKADEATDSLLVALPYGEMFSTQLRYEENGIPSSKYGLYNKVVSTSPFATEVLTKACGIPKEEIVKGWAPVSRDIMQSKKQSSYRKQLEQYYPEAKGKAILSVIVDATKTHEDRQDYETFPIKDFLCSLPDNIFVCTNMPEMVKACICLEPEYRCRIGLTKKLIHPYHLLYITDLLITNNSILASEQTACGKQAYCIDYSDTNFERYMKKHFPECMVTASNINEIIGGDGSGIGAMQALFGQENGDAGFDWAKQLAVSSPISGDRK